MAVIIISPAADADVDEILNYLAGKAGACGDKLRATL
jgi:plasmid stabilization system protein ParE